MRIAINCRSFLKQQYTGIGRYAYHLVDSLSKIDQENDYLLYVRKKLLDGKRKAPSFDSKNFKVKQDLFDKGLRSTLGDVDVYHAPSPDLQDIDNAKFVVTVHDLVFKAYPEGHTKETVDLSQKQMDFLSKRADKIICCSKSTADDLRKYYSINGDRVRIVYQGVDRNVFYPLKDEEKDSASKLIRSKGITGDYLLFVGTLEPRKNLKNILAAFSIIKNRFGYPGQLVISGMKGWMDGSISDLIDEHEIKNDTIVLGYLPNEELRIIYSRSKGLVFPSFYEGFGFPIVEAFSCGVPVLTSNISSCPEVAGNAAILVDPNDTEEMSTQMLVLLNDDEKRNNMIAEGLKRAEQFSFERTAMETLKVYKEVCGDTCS